MRRFLYVYMLCFFFFKQKTAYEMRMSDWSSDVCSSDLAACEGVAQRGHVGHVRREPQLDLRIIGGDDDVARFRHEGVADLAADLGADRDVLEVRVGRTQPPGLRAGEDRKSTRLNSSH